MIIGQRNRGFKTAVGQLTNTADANYSSDTYVLKILPSALKASGSIIRLQIQGLVVAGHVGTYSDTYIGLASSTAGANAYDFDGNQVRVTWAGGNSVSTSKGSLHLSDEITFTVDQTKAVLIAFNIAASSYVSYATGVGSGLIAYAKSGVSQAATTSKDTTGYIAVGGLSAILSKLDVKP